MILRMFRLSKFVTPLLACALLAPALYALAQSAPETPAPVVSRSPTKPLLWKVSDKNNSIYLLGSFHLLKPDDYPLSGDVEAAFADAKKVVFEVPPAELTDPAVAQKMIQFAGYSDGNRLSTVLSPELREKLSRLLGADRVSQLDAFEPWYVNLSLVIGVSQGMGFQPEQGLDQYLARRALEANKPTAGLETVDEQLQTLDSVPMNEQVAGLQDFVDDPKKAFELLRDTHAAWRDADVARLNALVIDEVRTETPETYRIVNVQRNDAWLPQLQRLLDKSRKDDTLVVVGAMHLLGPDGVVEKLQAKGYQVERICSACVGP